MNKPVGSVNKVIIVGRLTGAPIVTATKTSKFCKMLVQTQEEVTRKDKDAQIITDTLEVTAWGYLADACISVLRPGMDVCVEGKVRTNTSEYNGRINRWTNVVAEFVSPIGVRLDDLAAPRGRTRAAPAPAKKDPFDQEGGAEEAEGGGESEPEAGPSGDQGPDPF